MIIFSLRLKKHENQEKIQTNTDIKENLIINNNDKRNGKLNR